MPIKKCDLQQSLQGKFGFEEVAGSRHERLSLIINGRKVATTGFSRATDIDDSLLRQIAAQIWVSLNDLKRMHGCTISREDYLEHLRNSDHLS